MKNIPYAPVESGGRAGQWLRALVEAEAQTRVLVPSERYLLDPESGGTQWAGEGEPCIDRVLVRS